ncbi:pleiotropic regulatory locus1-like protein (nucleomorph) [Cryptomonas paramecium]|uniref:Pleiotropic regulatory locus1-like protein n=1 Tax=Cryptomonas paramaecium TaxID=2898 RepID=F2HHN3_9CRYP|nr:pleiotropic regulatory locus1-like protein [Cryptomonas paramecium]AEA38829.1 pleiotropic regulatory locus1-like protein [Cryptomonas paramecium]|mmetsp:Transcript_52165/g.136362  ORF Transcript_52165/g.136362 Transcript_52165/m.136362 type:complete len:318 (+) Transcript_52165:74-1027(+)
MYSKIKNSQNSLIKIGEKWTITKIIKGCPIYMDVLTTNTTGTIFATGTIKNKIYLWNTRYFKNSSIIETHLGKISTIIFDINPNHVFTGGGDCIFDEWDFCKNVLTRRYTGHSNSVTKLAKNFCLNLIISSSKDGTLKLWDNRVYKNILTLYTCGGSVNSFLNNDQSAHVISANSNGNIYFWDLKINKNTYIIKNSIREIKNIYQLINKKYLLAINKKSIIIHEKNKKISQKIINKKYTNNCSVCIKNCLAISYFNGKIRIINFHKKNIFFTPSIDNILYKNKTVNLAMEFNEKKGQLLITDMEKNIKIMEKKWAFV